MKRNPWTRAELAQFERLCNLASSPRQLERIEARFNMPAFVAEHGKPKCDAMYAHLKAKWTKEDA